MIQAKETSTRLREIADASRRPDGSDIPLGQQVRDAADLIDQFRAAVFAMATAPKMGKSIRLVLEDGSDMGAIWSNRPVCMLGDRCGGYPPGWATDGSDDTDFNLPIDISEVVGWRPA